MNNTRVYPTNEYKLYVTKTPYEALRDDYQQGEYKLPSVDPLSFDDFMLCDDCTAYIAKEPPKAMIKDIEFKIAPIGRYLADMYSHVTVFENNIVYSEDC